MVSKQSICKLVVSPDRLLVTSIGLARWPAHCPRTPPTPEHDSLGGALVRCLIPCKGDAVFDDCVRHGRGWIVVPCRTNASQSSVWWNNGRVSRWRTSFGVFLKGQCLWWQRKVSGRARCVGAVRSQTKLHSLLWNSHRVSVLLLRQQQSHLHEHYGLSALVQTRSSRSSRCHTKPLSTWRFQ